MSTLFGSVGVEGLPLPAPEVVERLQRIDPSLGIFWNHHEKCWCLSFQWREQDPRRAMIQNGEMHPDDDFDVIGYAPAEMRLEDAYALLERNLKHTSKDYAKGLLANIHQWNADKKAELEAPIVGEAMNEIEVFGGKLFANATDRTSVKVYQNAGRKSKKATKE